MKKIFALLICFKDIALFTWIFFFALSFAGKTPYTSIELFFISGVFTFLIYLFGAIIIFLFQNFNKKNDK